MLTPNVIAFVCGLAAGAVLGFVGRAGRFCTLAMLEDAFFGSDATRLKSFALAASIALVVTQVLAAAGFVDLSRSIYLTHSIPLVGAIIGGLMFGVGMALVGTCGFGTLVRICDSTPSSASSVVKAGALTPIFGAKPKGRPLSTK